MSIDHYNFESLEDTFRVVFLSNDAIEMNIGCKLT